MHNVYIVKTNVCYKCKDDIQYNLVRERELEQTGVEYRNGSSTVAGGSVVAPFKKFRPVAIYVSIYQLLISDSTTHFTLILCFSSI